MKMKKEERKKHGCVFHLLKRRLKCALEEKEKEDLAVRRVNKEQQLGALCDGRICSGVRE